MREINGKTQICGLIGKPVEHTLSPVIHNYLAKSEGRNLVYVPFLVEDVKIKEAVEGAFALNMLGLNVTVPHKSSIMLHLKEVDKLAKDIGAVNTLVRMEEGYKGYNTDMPGLLRAMQSENIAIKGELVVILGAGGAARAVALMCAREGAEAVYLLNRSLEKAKAVAAEVNYIHGQSIITPMKVTDYKKLPQRKCLAIQATSVGLHPNVDDVIISDEDFYKKVHTGVDLIYNPYTTKFMKLVQGFGGQTMNGLKMLLYQGIIAYELWNKVTISEAVAQEILMKMKKELKIDG